VHARLEEAGHHLHFTETVGARMPDPDETAALQLLPGVPVLTIIRIAYTATGEPVELNDIVLGADRHELVYDIPPQ
jgi:GntR family transcriptional regulator